MSETSSSTPKPSNRRLFRWLLAAFVLAVMITVIAVALPIYRDHQAAREWEQLGGHVLWSDLGERLANPHDNSLRRRVKGWFQHASVAEYRVGKHTLNDLLPLIRDFRKLDGIGLMNTPTTAEDIREIANQHPGLKYLALEQCGVDDAALREIGRLQPLKQLMLTGASISDQGISHLSRLEHLQTLGLSQTEITDEGLWKLRTLKNLRELDLSNTLVTDEGVERLRAEIPALEVWDD